RVVLCDACTGECSEYATGDVPGWGGRAYPADLLLTQYNWSGRYIHGWWNSWIGQSGVYQVTPGTENSLGYNYLVKDNDIWVYTGVTSATSDNSIIGFVLINQRTSESHFYSVAGATETSAMNSAEGQVQNLGYDATFPLLLNISDRPTYFMALKDNAGLVKKYAMIDIERYQNVAIGDTVSECEKSYRALLSTNGLVSGDDTQGSTATGTISHISEAVIDGNSHFYLTLAGDGHIYDCPLPAMMEAVALTEGQTVTLTYQEGSPTSTVTAIER
ncbi:MAG: Tat pathway signal sequence, partial [Coriobacteriales bacterium]